MACFDGAINKCKTEFVVNVKKYSLLVKYVQYYLFVQLLKKDIKQPPNTGVLYV